MIPGIYLVVFIYSNEVLLFSCLSFKVHFFFERALVLGTMGWNFVVGLNWFRHVDHGLW